MLLMSGLGLCEHCGILVTVEMRPVDGAWICVCGGELTHESFGYTQDGQKTRWVGPDGEWINEKPTEDFKLGDLHIVDHRPSVHLYSR